MKLTSLKSCPFCGGRPSVFLTRIKDYKGDAYLVGCGSWNNCSMSVRTMSYKTRATAYKHWNKQGGFGLLTAFELEEGLAKLGMKITEMRKKKPMMKKRKAS